MATNEMKFSEDKRMARDTDTTTYSFIIPYRDRKEHLEKFLSHMKLNFSDMKIEYIIVQQNDNQPFRRGCLLNDGANRANGDILVLHDVDYLPDAGTEYWAEGTDVFQPVKRVNFVNMDGTPRAEEDIPSGYRHFSNSVDDNFYGAVTCFSREAFFKVNGFNPLYEGWGLEDADLRERIKQAGLTVVRGTGTFSALPHKDSFPGAQNDKFQRNTAMFNEWSKWAEYGASNSFPVTSDSEELAFEHGVDLWTKSSYWAITSPNMKQFFSLNEVTKYYEDTPEKHTAIWNGFKAVVNATDTLKNHRDWVVANRWGYGNRAFHWMWTLLIREMPENFRFLEIGVFKGQICNLVSGLNRDFNKKGQLFGVTPLNTTDGHPDDNYEECIAQIYGQFGLDASDLTIIEGYSQDEEIINLVRNEAPFNVVFIDGGHDYEVVVSDLKNYAELLKIGGYLIVDDSSNQLQIPDGLIRMNWKGIPDVSRATQEIIDTDPRFVHLFAVGHNRVFKRIS
jgi:hypothetical protein